MMAEIFISKSEEQSLGNRNEEINAWRTEIGVPESDDLPTLTETGSYWNLKKRERSGTADAMQLQTQVRKRLNFVPEHEEDGTNE